MDYNMDGEHEMLAEDDQAMILEQQEEQKEQERQDGQLPAPLVQAFRLGSDDVPFDESSVESVLISQQARHDVGLQMLIESELGYGDISAELYPPTGISSLQTLLLSIHHSSLNDLVKNGLYFYLLLNGSPENLKRAEEFARSRYLPESWMVQMRGFWDLDHDEYKSAIVRLSDPRCFYQYDTAQTIMHTLSLIPSPDLSSSLLISYILYTKHSLLSSSLRDAYLKALCISDFPKAWKWVRDLEFGEDVKIQKVEEGMFEFEEDDEGLSGPSEEEKEMRMEKEVLMERKRLLLGIFKNVFDPTPEKGPLNQLLWLPIDRYEQSVLIDFLLDPRSSLPQSSFDLLHDLITMRLLNNGQHASAIQLDRKVTELERALGRNVADPRARTERRSLVNAMIGVLPEVQRKMLLLERDMQDNPVRVNGANPKQAMVNGAHGREGPSQTVQQTGSRPTAGAPTAQSAPASPARFPLSASANFRQAPNPATAVYQALLQSSTTASASAGPASPIARLQASVAGGVSPRIQATYVQSPFNVPPRLPIGSSNRAGSPFHRNVTETSSQQGFDDIHRHQQQSRVSSPDTDIEDRESTPVPQRQTRKSAASASIHQKEKQKEAEKAPRQANGDLQQKAPPSVPDSVEDAIPGAFPVSKPPAGRASVSAQPVQAAGRKRMPTARAKEAADQQAARRKTVGPSRTRAQKAEDAHVDQPEESTKMRKQRKAPASDEDNIVHKPKAKRSRATPSEAATSPDRNRRTRQQSVAHSVTSEYSESGMNLRRSARHSLAGSPVPSETSDAPAKRRQTLGGARQASATPGRSGIKTRRQAAMSPQQEE